MTEAITQGIKIRVNTVFGGMHKRNKQNLYLYDYYISIENLSANTVQLSSRHWEIYDSLNQPEIVEGDGIIGIQPVLKSGEKHSYKSHCILLSNCGSMKGYYNMINLDNENCFEVEVPSFQLQTRCFMN